MKEKSIKLHKSTNILNSPINLFNSKITLKAAPDIISISGDLFRMLILIFGNWRN